MIVSFIIWQVYVYNEVRHEMKRQYQVNLLANCLRRPNEATPMSAF